MDWFKHPTGSHEDPDISDAEDEFGPIAYVVFFKVLEIYGREFNRLNGNGELELSKSKLSRNLRMKWKRIRLVLEFYCRKKRILFSETEKRATIAIPKFIIMASNWTKRQHNKPTEAPTEAPTAKEVEEEKKKKKNKKKPIIDGPTYETKKKRKLTGQKLTWFLEFWSAFNYSQGKAVAADAWLEIQGLNDELFQSIIIAAKREAERRPDLIAKDKTPKMAQGWLSGKRWEDEYEDEFEIPKEGFMV